MPIVTEVARLREVRRHRRRRHDAGEARRGHRPVAQDDHRVARTPTAARASRSRTPTATPSSCPAARRAGEARYFLPVGANISSTTATTIEAGDVIAKIPRETTKTKDITGGLPRVAELFEARKPKDHAVICEIDGIVSLRQGHQGQAQGAHRRPRSAIRAST